jgi:uncharacterized coiled-coil protein SlyX
MRLLLLAIILFTYRSVAAQWTSSSGDIYYNGGKVGIGVIAPAGKLDVRGGYITTRNNDAYGGAFVEGQNGISYFGSLGRDKIAIGNSGNWERVVVLDNGNVGVNVTQPTGTLHVNGTFRVSSNTEYADIYFQEANPVETGYADVWPDQNERAVMFRPNAYLDSWGAGGAGIQFYTYDINGGEWGTYTGGYKRAMVIRRNGNIGVGTATPSAKFHLADAGKSIRMGNLNGTSTPVIELSDIGTMQIEGTGSDMRFLTSGTERFRITNTGNIGIGTADTKGYKLAVNGDAIFTKVKVKQYNTWPDFVFEKHYNLRPLAELETYIATNKHLPDIPSAKEISDKGLDLAENQAGLLKNLEELTLHLIEQNKKMQEMHKTIQQLTERLEKLESSGKQ